jgi:uncharacterized protein (TIGR03382 family)
LFDLTPPAPGSQNAWDSATAHTGDPDLNLPEPSLATVLVFGSALLLRRRRPNH